MAWFAIHEGAALTLLHANLMHQGMERRLLAHPFSISSIISNVRFWA